MAAERPRAWLCALLACLLVLRQDGVVLPCSLGLLCHAPLPEVEEVWCALMAYTPRDSAEALVLWTLVRESEMGRAGSMRLRTLASLAVVVGSLYTTHSNTGALTWAGGCLAARLGGRLLHRWGSADMVGPLPSASEWGAWFCEMATDWHVSAFPACVSSAAPRTPPLSAARPSGWYSPTTGCRYSNLDEEDRNAFSPISYFDSPHHRRLKRYNNMVQEFVAEEAALDVPTAPTALVSTCAPEDGFDLSFCFIFA